MSPLTSISLFLFGAIIGSFANVCILRVPAEGSIVFPGSRCPECKQPVAWYDNIPLLSWLVRGGARVIYFWHAKSQHILMLFVYPKNEQADLTPTQRRALRKIVEADYP